MDSDTKVKYLITGGAGFIGSNFIRFLFKNYKDSIEVINIDKLTYAGNSINLSDIERDFANCYTFIKGDINDDNTLQEIFSRYSPDRVINFAAESHVDRSINSPENFIKTNIFGTFKLLEHFKKSFYKNDKWLPNKLLIQISTDEVYGDAGSNLKFDECSPLKPSSPYAASKASADMLVYSYVRTYNAPIIITRSSNNFGPYQYPEKFIPLIINNLMEKKPIPLYGEGKNIRDWLFVEDNISAIDAIANNGNIGEIYNIGAGNEISNIDLAKKIITVFNKLTHSNLDKNLIKFVKDRKGHDFRYALQTKKIENTLGWKPKNNFDEALHKTILWYIKNRNWLKRISKGGYNSYYRQNYGDL